MPAKRKNKTAPVNYPSAPLLCWDIFLEGYYEQMALGKDIQQLARLSKKHGWKVTWDAREILKQGKVILVADLSLHIIFASSNVVKLKGITPEKMIGKKLETAAQPVLNGKGEAAHFIVFEKIRTDDI